MIETTPGVVVDNEEPNWGFGDSAVGLSDSGDQCRAVFYSIRNLVSQLGFSVPEGGLDVFKLADEKIR